MQTPTLLRDQQQSPDGLEYPTCRGHQHCHRKSHDTTIVTNSHMQAEADGQHKTQKLCMELCNMIVKGNEHGPTVESV